MTIGHFSQLQAQIVIGFVVALLLPYITAVFTHYRMNDKQKIAISAIVAFAAACGIVLLTGGWRFTDIATAFSILFPLSQTFFRNIALKLGVQVVEDATSAPDQRRSINDSPLPTTSTIESAVAISDVSLRDMVEEKLQANANREEVN